LSSGFRATNFLPFLIGFFVRPESLFLRPDPQYCKAPARAGAVKVGRRTNLSMRFALARPYLDSSEHGGPLDGVGMTIRGEPAFECAYQSRHNLVFGGSKDPNHDAVMRIGGEAPRRRTHSFPRHKSHDTSRDPATSNRHRRPVTSGRTGPKLFQCVQRPLFIAPAAERCHLAPRPLARAATRRSEACAPRPRSWSCEYRGRSWCGLETTAPTCCLFGT